MLLATVRPYLKFEVAAFEAVLLAIHWQQLALIGAGKFNPEMDSAVRH